MNKAVFFDRDGIVNRRIIDEYVKSPAEFIFLPEIFNIIRNIKSAGFLAIIITNQQGIGKGLMSEDELFAVHAFMQKELQRNTGFSFDDIYYCGDLAHSGSFRRKPAPGMILEAQKKWNIDLSVSWMIGDSISDAEAGKSAGTRTILVGDFLSQHIPSADRIFPNLSVLSESLSDIFEGE